MKKIVVGVALVLGALGVGIWLVSRPSPSDEAQIAKLIIDVKQAVEAKSVGGVLKHISDDYDDGGYTKRDITRLAVSGFREPEPFHVHVEAPDIWVSGDTAEARVRADFWTGESGLAPDPVHLDLLVEFIKVRGGWKVIRASGWERAVEVGQ